MDAYDMSASCDVQEVFGAASGVNLGVEVPDVTKVTRECPMCHGPHHVGNRRGAAVDEPHLRGLCEWHREVTVHVSIVRP